MSRANEISITTRSKMTEPSFETGRYLYCVVQSPESESIEFSTSGVDGERVYVLTAGNIGVAVHECNTLYDTADMDVVRKWLLEHQNAIDTAGERFGTPIPFQFDTILQGNDERVRTWLESERDTFVSHFDTLQGCWEYRIDVRRNEATLEEELTDDEKLTELDDRMADSSSGTAHLLEKQYEQRLKTLKQQRRAERTAALTDQLDTIVRDLRDLGRKQAALDVEIEDSDEELTREARLAVLARKENEGDVGDLLDDIAAEPGVEIRFTGPWPPYTFAPTIEEEDLENE